jgi:hypothetical protein
LGVQTFRIAVSAALAYAISTGSTLASPGCDRVAAKFNVPMRKSAGQTSVTIPGFFIGDALEIQSTVQHLHAFNGAIHLESGDGTRIGSGIREIRYTVTGRNQDTTLTLKYSWPASPWESVGISSKCSPAAGR